MGKEKKINLGIKTTRYFTKNCTKCGSEYPNWFVACPRCGTAWDAVETGKNKQALEEFNKNIKIVVKMTEDNFNQAINKVQLVFSANQGKSWYQMPMNFKTDYFLAEIAEVPIGTVIIYYIEVSLADGETVIENNDNKYFYYKVGGPSEGLKEEELPQREARAIQENIQRSSTPPKEFLGTPVKQTQNKQSPTIFGKPQTQIDPDLKVCHHCKSKIKRMWSVCPICGKMP